MFKLFALHAGVVGNLHTGTGVKTLYRICYHDKMIYADDTYQLRVAFEAEFYVAPDGLYYRNKSDYEISLSNEAGIKQ